MCNRVKNDEDRMGLLRRDNARGTVPLTGDTLRRADTNSVILGCMKGRKRRGKESAIVVGCLLR